VRRPPLLKVDRDPFFEAVAQELQGRSEIGDGDIDRAIRNAQKKYFRPPLETDTLVATANRKPPVAARR
jgi:hypothetical protein